MTRLLRRSGSRWLRRHPGQTGLAVLGVALGVAVVVSVDVASGSAERSFRLAHAAATGRATHQILGGPRGIDERLFAGIASLGVPAAPVVEGTVSTVAGGSLRLLGVDPLREAEVRPYLAAGGAGESDARGGASALVRDLLVVPGAVVATPATAAALGVVPGEAIALADGAALRLAGHLAPADATSAAALEGLLVADIATAQEVLGAIGFLDRVDLVLPDGAAGEAALRRLQCTLAPGLTVAAAASRQRASLAMIEAFQVNLTALSLLALVCGAFLIYNTATFSVLQRRETFGLLRTLGVGRDEILRLVLIEALAIGALGTLLGLAGGAWLGEYLVRLVSRTVNDLYFAVAVRSTTLGAWTLAKGLALGIVATLGAAWPAAREATAVPARQALLRSALESRARRGMRRGAIVGTVLLALGTAALFLPGRSLPPRFAALFAALLGAALLIPALSVAFVRLVAPALQRTLGPVGLLGARTLVAGVSRTGIALAALAVAVAVATGVDLMIGSFRGTVEQWLGYTLQADLYVAPAERRGRAESALLEPRFVERLERLPGVAHANLLRRATVPHPSGEGEPLRLAALSLDARSHDAFAFRAVDAERVWTDFHAGRGVIVSEPFARHRQLDLGDGVPLRTPRGDVELPVRGIFTDYSSDRGLVFLDLELYRRLFDDDSVSSAALFLAPSARPAEVAARVRRLGAVEVQPTAALRRASLEVFDRTFAITGVLRLLTLLVAVVGVVAALGALALERRRELAMLRAVGLEPRQLVATMLVETGLLGLAAGLAAMPLGVGLAAVMVYVINTRAFGWSMALAVTPAALLVPVALAVGAALLAGAAPALRFARVPPALALRDEG